MAEEPNYNEIYGANPELQAELDFLPSKVRTKYIWNSDHSRWDLAVIIGDKTTEKDITNSWQYILVMRKMMHNFQGPWTKGGRYFIPEMAFRMSKKGGGESKPSDIARILNRRIERQAINFKEEGLEEKGWKFIYPDDYSYDGDSVKQMVKDHYNRWHKNRSAEGEKVT